MERTIGFPGREPRREFWLGLAVFLLAATFGGTFLGGAASWLGSAFGFGRYGVAVAVAALMLVGLDSIHGQTIGGVRIVPPTSRRQVSPRTIAAHSRVFTGASWGFQLGIGVVTAVNTWALWSMFLGLLMLNSIGLGIICGAFYGAVRGVQPLVAATFVQRRRVSCARGAARLDQRLKLGPSVAAILVVVILISA